MKLQLGILGAARSAGWGDRIFVYQRGGVSGLVGLAMARPEPRDDPKNVKSAVVDLEFAGRLEPPTSLTEIKQSKLFDDWALARQGRRSTMAAPESFVWMKKRYRGAKI